MNPCRALWIAFLILSSCASLPETVQRINQDLAGRERLAYDRVDNSSIVNGTAVSSTEESAKLAVMVLVTRNSKLSVCTGVFVKKNILATAAHCVHGVEPSNIRIVYQVRGALDPEQVRDGRVKKIKIHEKYDGTPQSYSDLALLSLDFAPEDYKPLPLFESPDQVTTDDVLLIGYGITSETKKDSMILRKTTKSFKNDLRLRETFVGIEQNSESGGFCRGDSGAPVLVTVKKTKKLFAINSFTVGLEENKECHTASVALAIAHFGPWIKSNASAL